MHCVAPWVCYPATEATHYPANILFSGVITTIHCSFHHWSGCQWMMQWQELFSFHFCGNVQHQPFILFRFLFLAMIFSTTNNFSSLWDTMSQSISRDNQINDWLLLWKTQWIRSARGSGFFIQAPWWPGSTWHWFFLKNLVPILSPSDSFKLPKLNILPHSYFAPPNSCLYLQAIVASPVEISEPHKDRNPVTSLLTTIVSMI